jgi:hypothetical protein
VTGTDVGSEAGSRKGAALMGRLRAAPSPRASKTHQHRGDRPEKICQTRIRSRRRSNTVVVRGAQYRCSILTKFYGKTMTNRRLIDRQRESALSLEVGGEESSPITHLLSTKNSFYVLKANGVYQVKMADDIDPERTNPNIHTHSQQVIGAGTDHAVVSTILLTTMFLFDTKNSEVDEFAGELLDRVVFLTKKLIDIDQAIQKISEDIEEKELRFSNSKLSAKNFSIPSILGLDSRIYEIFMIADKAKDLLVECFRITFEQKQPHARPLDHLSAVTKEAMKERPQLVPLVDEIFRYFSVIRQIRNASEHPKKGNRVIESNFCIQANGTVNPPLIEVEHPTNPISQSPAIEFLRGFMALFLEHTEFALVLLKVARLMKHNPFGEMVAEFPLEERRHPNVRFYRAIHFGGEPRILG